MIKLNQTFFTDNEVLFVGYSQKNQFFCNQVYKAFLDKGIKVYPLNNRKDASFDMKIYRDLDELPKVPQCAYILLNKGNTEEVYQQLAAKGVKRMLFQSKRSVTPEILEKCKEMGIETIVACPMMVFGSGIHKLHGFFAGVRE